MSDPNNNTPAPFVYVPQPGDETPLSQALATTGPARVPKDAYKAFVVKTEFRVGRTNGTPYLNMECELRDNPQVISQGQTLDVNGQKGFFSLFLTQKAKDRLAKFLKSAKMPTDLSLAMILSQCPQAASMFDGKTFRVICESKPDPQVNHAGQAILDDNGQQVIFYKFEMNDVP